jgi:hypothetical protein
MKLATDVNFIKRFGAINAAIGILLFISTQDMLLGHKLCQNKIYEIGHWCLFHKTFLVQFMLLSAYCLRF